MELVKVITGNGLVVVCELKSQTIKELKTEKQVTIRKLRG